MGGGHSRRGDTRQAHVGVTDARLSGRWGETPTGEVACDVCELAFRRRRSQLAKAVLGDDQRPVGVSAADVFRKSEAADDYERTLWQVAREARARLMWRQYVRTSVDAARALARDVVPRDFAEAWCARERELGEDGGSDDGSPHGALDPATEVSTVEAAPLPFLLRLCVGFPFPLPTCLELEETATVGQFVRDVRERFNLPEGTVRLVSHAAGSRLELYEHSQEADCHGADRSTFVFGDAPLQSSGFFPGTRRYECALLVERLVPGVVCHGPCVQEDPNPEKLQIFAGVLDGVFVPVLLEKDAAFGELYDALIRDYWVELPEHGQQRSRFWFQNHTFGSETIIADTGTFTNRGFTWSERIMVMPRTQQQLVLLPKFDVAALADAVENAPEHSFQLCDTVADGVGAFDHFDDSTLSLVTCSGRIITDIAPREITDLDSLTFEECGVSPGSNLFASHVEKTPTIKHARKT
jgi:hypothetical protein